MWRLVIGAVFVAAACASPQSQPARPDASTVDSAPDAPADSAATAAAATSVPGVLPEGFGLVAARVTEPDGSVCELCLWLADNGRDRSRGLMFVTDLGGADGMAFLYPEPRSGWFTMKNTVLPLSIAFFAPDGAYVEAFDMDPCVTAACTRHFTPEGFMIAVETLQGGLADIGMVPGSALELLDTACVPD
jgi:uncharacterized membrane protein (UPF0127 family)